MQGYIVSALIGVCVILMIFLFITDSLSQRRKCIIFTMVFTVAMLTISEQLAHMFNGDTSTTGIFVARASKFMHYVLSLVNIYVFSVYLRDVLKSEGKAKRTPRDLVIADFILLAGIVTIIISQFTKIYYYYDTNNIYRHGSFYWLSYVYSSVTILIIAANVIRYRKIFSRKLFWVFLTFTLAPMFASILHFVFRGVSLINLTVVAMTVLLYCFAILDSNEVVATAHKKDKLMLSQTAQALAEAIDAKDPYTSGHSRRVAEYSAEIAEACGKDIDYCQEIYMIGLLHDVGKIGIPGSIINKKGRLTDEEYELIKTHPEKGGEILSKISMSPNLPIGAKYHHERYDGKGYPEGLKGEEIPEIARIIAVADTYDAMASKRSYRDSLPMEKIKSELKNGLGTQFDPEFAKVMLDLIDSGKI